MSAAERNLSSLEPPASVEVAGSVKKDKDDDRKRRRAALRLIKNETNTPDKKEEPKRSPFRLNLEAERPKQKDKDDEPIEKAESKQAETIEDSFDELDIPSGTERPEVPLEQLDDNEHLEAAQIFSEDQMEMLANEPENNEVDKSVNDARYDFYSKIRLEGKTPQVARDEVFLERDIDPSTVVIEDDDADTEADANEIIEPIINGHEVDISADEDEGELPLNFAPADADDTEPPIAAAPSIAGGGNAGGNNRPPTGGGGNGGRGGSSGGRGSGGGQPPRPNPMLSTRYAFNKLPTGGVLPTRSYNQIRRDHHDYWSGFMTGGMLGYFIGHRRGRIKTEKKLNSVKKSLEKQIKKVDKEVKAHDKAISKIVREKAIIAPIPIVIKERPIIPKSEKLLKPVHEIKVINKESLAPVPIPATEIHLGRLVMAETPKEAAVREQIRKEVKLRAPEASKQAEKAVETKRVTLRPETMSSSELLKESENIIIDGTSLRQIYESQLVGEKGLRRLVAEHLHGGDLKTALRREVVERQIDFERDPIMRDMASSGSSSQESGQKSLEQMIKRAESSLATSQEQVAFLKAKAAHEDKEKTKNSQHARAINAVFLAIITILVVVIILLGFLRHS